LIDKNFAAHPDGPGLADHGSATRLTKHIPGGLRANC
jgi:hypothetical protein